MSNMSTNRKENLTVVAFQKDFLEILHFQIETIFGGQIRLKKLLASALPSTSLGNNDFFFSTEPNLFEHLKAQHVPLNRLLLGNQAVNMVNTGELVKMKESQRFLVVSDGQAATDDLISDLKKAGFDHDYVPFVPGSPRAPGLNWVITSGEMDLIPEGYSNVISVGPRVLSMDSVQKINSRLAASLDLNELTQLYIRSLVSVAQHWPTRKKNNYVTTWMGLPKDHDRFQRFDQFTTKSEDMKTLVFIAQKMAQTSSPIHISGEVGTGKMEVAKAVHHESEFSKGPFRSIRCSTRSTSDLARELFGWEEDDHIYPGLLESTFGGSLCLEDIDSVPLDFQGRLFQALNEKKVKREGGKTFTDIHVRVIATSVDDLRGLLEQNKIQQTLYYQLSALSCRVPTLANRQEDFEILLHQFLEDNATGKPITIDNSVMEVLKAYQWKGNLQELYNVLSYLTCIAEDRITLEMLPYHISQSPPLSSSGNSTNSTEDWRQTVLDIEKVGFLKEYLEILRIFREGKQKNQSYGRAIVLKLLKIKGIGLSMQQLRSRQERLNDLGLLNVSIGRRGSTISPKGEQFLQAIEE